MPDIADVLRLTREKQGLTQETVAERLGMPQSYVSKLETGERQLKVNELADMAASLGVPQTRLLNMLEDFDSVFDRWDISEQEMTELIDGNPSLRGMILGYAAEVKFRHMYLEHRDDITSHKDDDHDRTKKGDRRLQYKGREIVVEVKSLQTKTVKYDAESDIWTGESQVDASDRRIVQFKDNTELDTTLLLVGEFDILAVNCFAFGNEWKFVFALNHDLETSRWKKYTDEQQKNLLKSMQPIQYPPVSPYTTDFDEILERAWKLKQAAPDVIDIDD